MAPNKVVQRFAVSETDLTTPSSAIGPYPLGFVWEVQDDAAPNAVKKYMYVKSHTTLTQYQPYTVVFANTSQAEVVTAAPVTLASGVTPCIPQVAFTSGYYGFVQIFGACSALLANETHVAGDYLELLTTGTTLIVDGTSGSTAYSAKGIAIQVGTLSGAGTATVFLFGGIRTSLVSAT